MKDSSIQNISEETWLNDSHNLIKNNGFVVIKDFLPVDFISTLHQKTIDIFLENKIKNVLRDVHTFKDGTISSLHNLFDYLPFYLKVLEFDNVKKISTKCIGDISNLRMNSSYFAKPKKIGIETKPHQDNAFFCLDPADVLTFWFPVQPSKKHNGPLYYYPGSNNLGNLKHIPEGNLGTSMTVTPEDLNKIKKNTKPLYVELDIGDCLIHNGLVVHGSEKNDSNEDRNAFNFSIFGHKAIKSNKLYNEYKKNLNTYLLKNKNTLS